MTVFTPPADTMSAVPDTVNVSRDSSKSSGKTLMIVQLVSVPVDESRRRMAFSGAKSTPPVCGERDVCGVCGCGCVYGCGCGSGCWSIKYKAKIHPI